MNAQRPPIIQIGDSPGIDFLNSRAKPDEKAIEWLANGEDLIAWLEQMRMVEPEAVAQIRAMATPGELDNLAAQARDLREWFRGFVARYLGAPLPDSALEDLRPLNALLERGEAYGQVRPRLMTGSREGAARADATAFARVQLHRWRSPASLLLPIAEAMADMICSAEFQHVKHCEGHDCTLLFVDRTKGHKRRWCSMAVCGNRAKQAAHREKKIAHQHDD